MAEKVNSSHWVKGQSGNPTGRRRGFRGMAQEIRKRTEDGKVLVNFAMGVLENATQEHTHAHQWDALKWLADRGWGKSVATTIELGGELHELPDLPDVTELDPAQLHELDSVLERIIDGAKRSKVKV